MWPREISIHWHEVLHCDNRQPPETRNLTVTPADRDDSDGGVTFNDHHDNMHATDSERLIIAGNASRPASVKLELQAEP